MKNTKSTSTKKSDLTFADKLKLLSEKDKEYLNGYIDRAIKEHINKKGA